MHRIGSIELKVTPKTTFEDIRRTFGGMSRSHDPHLRLKEDESGAKTLYAHPKSKPTRTPGKIADRRQDATTFVVAKFKAQYPREKHVVDRVIRHIEADERFQNSNGNLELTASGIRLIGERMDSEIARGTIVVDLIASYSRIYGKEIAKSAVDLLAKGNAESGGDISPFPFAELSSDDARDAIGPALALQTARFAAEALFDPLVEDAFTNVDDFKKAAIKHFGIILGAQIAADGLQKVKPWLALYPVLDAFGMISGTGTGSLETLDERLPLSARCLLPPEKAASFVGAAEPNFGERGKTNYILWNQQITSKRLDFGANLVGNLLLESIDRFDLSTEEKKIVVPILAELADAEKTTEQDSSDKLVRLGAVFDKALAVRLGQWNDGQKRRHELGAVRLSSRSRKPEAPKLGKSVSLLSDSSQDNEKFGQPGEKVGVVENELQDWNFDPKLNAHEDSEESPAPSPRPRKVDINSRDSSTLETKKKKHAHLSKVRDPASKTKTDVYEKDLSEIVPPSPAPDPSHSPSPRSAPPRPQTPSLDFGTLFTSPRVTGIDSNPLSAPETPPSFPAPDQPRSPSPGRAPPRPQTPSPDFGALFTSPRKRSLNKRVVRTHSRMRRKNETKKPIAKESDFSYESNLRRPSRTPGPNDSWLSPRTRSSLVIPPKNPLQVALDEHTNTEAKTLATELRAAITAREEKLKEVQKVEKAAREIAAPEKAAQEMASAQEKTASEENSTMEEKVARENT